MHHDRRNRSPSSCLPQNSWSVADPGSPYDAVYPLVLSRIQDAVTGGESHLRRVVVGVAEGQAGALELLRDEQVPALYLPRSGPGGPHRRRGSLEDLPRLTRGSGAGAPRRRAAASGPRRRGVRAGGPWRRGRGADCAAGPRAVPAAPGPAPLAPYQRKRASSPMRCSGASSFAASRRAASTPSENDSHRPDASRHPRR